MSNDRTTLRRGVAYPRGSQLCREDVERLQTTVEDVPSIMVVMTGEKRIPKKGEWYFSGAIIAAYRAPEGLSGEYYIGQLVKVENVTSQRITELTEKGGE